MTREREIKVYIFKEDEELSREERLFRAAEFYLESETEAFGSQRADKGMTLFVRAEQELFRVEKTPLGKPFFPNVPELHLSISHSGAYWVCALAPVEVGVDIQEHTLNRSEDKQEAAVRFARMARRFFHPVEAKFVAAESFYRFFGVWAARESYVKYTGQGIDATFSEHCVIPGGEELWPELTPLPEQRISLLSLPRIQQLAKEQHGQGAGTSWHAQGAWFWEAVLEEHYTLCVCAGEEMSCRVIRCF